MPLVAGRRRRVKVIYTRYSAENQLASSIVNQHRLCATHLKALGLNADEYVLIKDEAISGQLESRPGWDQVRLMIAEGRLEHLVVAEQSRIDRADRAPTILKDIVAQRGRCTCVTEGIDTIFRNWMFLVRMFSVQHSTFSDLTAQRVRGGLEGRVRDGNGSAGDACYGYISVPREAAGGKQNPNQKTRKDIEISDDAASVVKEVFRLFTNGVGINAIARHINSSGMKLPPNRRKNTAVKPWLVKTILSNPKYIGKWAWGVTVCFRDGQGKPHIHPRDNGPVVTLDRPDLRIIDDVTWNKAQQRLRKQQEIAGRDVPRGPKAYHRNVHSQTLTRGLVFCSSCGAKMHVTGNAKQTKVIGCSNRAIQICDRRTCVPLDRCENEVANFVSAALLADNPWLTTFMNRLNDMVRKSTSEVPAETTRLRKERDAVKKEIDNVVKAIRGGIQSETLSKSLTTLEVDLAGIEDMLQSINQVTNVELPTEQWVRDELRNLKSLLAEVDPIALALLRKMIGPIQADAVIAPGMKNGYSVIRFRPNLPALAIDLISKQVPALLHFSVSVAEVAGEPIEVKIALGKTPRSDQLAADIYRRRQAGESWREITKATGVPHGNAHPLYMRYKKYLESLKD